MGVIRGFKANSTDGAIVTTEASPTVVMYLVKLLEKWVFMNPRLRRIKCDISSLRELERVKKERTREGDDQVQGDQPSSTRVISVVSTSNERHSRMLLNSHDTFHVV